MKKTRTILALLSCLTILSSSAAAEITVNGEVDTTALTGSSAQSVTFKNESTLKRTQGSNLSWGQAQIGTLTLEALEGEQKATATVEVLDGHDYGMLNGSFADAILTLNGGTLTKTGNGTFMMVNVKETDGDSGTISVADGTLKVQEGAGNPKKDLRAAGLTVSVDGGTFVIARNATIKSLTGTAGTTTINSGKTLTLETLTLSSGTMTLNGDGTLAVSDSITVKTGATLIARDEKVSTLTLAGGKVKVSGSGDFNARHFASLTLTANSTLDLTSANSGLINKDENGFVTSTLDLGNRHELTLTGTSRFCLMDVETQGKGSLAFADSGAYLQVAHSLVSGHTADLSKALLKLNGTTLVIARGNKLMTAGLDKIAEGAAASTIADEFSTGTSGTSLLNPEIVIVGDGAEHTYMGRMTTTQAVLSMTGAGTQNFDLTSDATFSSLTAQKGTMQFYLNGHTLSTGALTLSGGVVNVFTDSAEGTAAQITTTNGLTVTQDTTMEANLVVSGGTITFADNATLTMGCSVSIGATDAVTVVLTQDMVDAVAATGRYDLFTSVESATLNGDNITFVAAEGAALNENAPYSLKWDGEKIYVTPEPATATLSLLALAGLAARRRRH